MPRSGSLGEACLPALTVPICPARLELLARLTLNAGKHAGNQPARLTQLNDGNDRAILVQGDEGPAQVVRLGHRGTPSIRYSDEVAISRRPPHSIYRSRFLVAASRARLALGACMLG